MTLTHFPKNLLVVCCLGLCALGVGCRPKPREQAVAPAAPRAVPAPVIQDPVHITRTGKAYHQAGCRYLEASDYVEGRKEAISQGLTPCKVCQPSVPAKDPAVHVTRSGKAYHKAGCRSLDRSDFTEPLSKALGQGLHACPKCGG